jgi:hypothetical protein
MNLHKLCACGCGGKVTSTHAEARFLHGHHMILHNRILHPLEKRFWRKVQKIDGSDSCWIWTGKLRRGGGRIKMDGHLVSASRAAWKLEHGELPSNLDVLHHCDNPACVRASHLFLGTHTDNMRDMVKKGRAYLQRHPEETQGIRHPMAKLTEEKVREIRRRTDENRQALADEYGVAKTLIGMIQRKEIWKHLL